MFTPDTSPSEFLPFSTHVSARVLKTTGGDFMVAWRLAGMPFVGREAWELEHRHATFNRLLQSLRAPDYVNVAFWVHDVRRRQRIDARPRFTGDFNQSMSDLYHQRLSSQKLMQNELFLTMLYRPSPDGKALREKHGNLGRLEAEQR